MSYEQKLYDFIESNCHRVKGAHDVKVNMMPQAATWEEYRIGCAKQGLSHTDDGTIKGLKLMTPETKQTLAICYQDFDKRLEEAMARIKKDMHQMCKDMLDLYQLPCDCAETRCKRCLELDAIRLRVRDLSSKLNLDFKEPK